MLDGFGLSGTADDMELSYTERDDVEQFEDPDTQRGKTRNSVYRKFGKR